MTAIVFGESQKGICKKSAFEVVSFAHQMGVQDIIALVTEDTTNGDVLGQYGASKVYKIKGLDSGAFDSKVWAKAIADFSSSHNGNIVIFSHSSFGKSLAGRVAVRLGAGLVSGVNALPEGDMFSKSVFSGKATIKYQIKSATKVISVMGNTMKPIAIGQSVAVETIDLGAAQSSTKVLEIKRVEGTVPLPEAEIVVSAGRGLKDPSNWGIIEDLAKALGATTACSRPVADAGWRPHHEHVGQTGIAIRPNLYFAIGISGAIQHLAGVNNSKTIVVINKDPEAPFFKAGDYGVCGDLFEIVPKLTEAVKKFKETHS